MNDCKKCKYFMSCLLGFVKECPKRNRRGVINMAIDNDEASYNKGYADGSLAVTSEITNKIIDDFVNSLKQYFVILPHDIGVIEMKAEQFKTDIQDQGKFQIFPVPVGTTVFKFEPTSETTPKKFIKTIITRYEVYEDSVWMTFLNGLGRNIEDFGTWVFLTEEEARKKLKEINNAVKF